MDICRCYLPLIVSLAFLLCVRGDAWDYADDDYAKSLYNKIDHMSEPSLPSSYTTARHLEDTARVGTSKPYDT